MSTSTEPTQIKHKEIGGVLVFVGIVLLAAILRGPLNAVGPLIPAIRDSLLISNTVVGAVSTLPLLAFAFVSPFAPKLANHFGIEKTIFLSLIVLGIGIILRSITGVSLLFIGTALIGIAIAFGNVLLPGFIKMSYPFKVGIMTGIYSVSMNIFGSIATGISAPLAEIKYIGWQGSLGSWILLVGILLFIWYYQMKNPLTSSEFVREKTRKKTNMWTSFTAWQVTIFMGIQSLMFYTTTTWLPEVLQYNGYSPSKAGWTVSLMLLSTIPLTFLVPVIADRMKNQMVLGALTGLSFCLAIIGFLYGPNSFIIVYVLLIGVGCSGFSLAMMFFSLRTKDGFEAAELSGMAQSFGYLLAAFGPVLFGGFYDLTQSWTVPFMMLLILSVINSITGVLAGRNVTI